MPDQLKFTLFANDRLQFINLLRMKFRNLSAAKAPHVVMMGMTDGMLIADMALCLVGFPYQSRFYQMRQGAVDRPLGEFYRGMTIADTQKESINIKMPLFAVDFPDDYTPFRGIPHPLYLTKFPENSFRINHKSPFLP